MIRVPGTRLDLIEALIIVAMGLMLGAAIGLWLMGGAR
jgi:hypothetical protein